MYAVNDWLRVGKYRETRDPGLLGAMNIGAMLQLAELVEQPGITTLYLPVEDGIPLSLNLLARGLVFVEDQYAAGKNILIACGAGISRAVTFSMAALREAEGISLVEAYRAINQVHPMALPHPALLESLCQYYPDESPNDLFYAAYGMERFRPG